ncbi:MULTISPECIES: hypothetical protein [Reichenbachiella]|uniref:Uncharacterized protein n=1 Tax=Reichenbachiella agariperforans TaxID=156994 RepID=A0A1M6L597_REIAG|nr:MULTISPECIES: hypothetical protein [Reichenbachiella]MBU2913793.1 hypothetical protein [Reichenbachiella agariperforans]RJE74283.1 hypothetical protein BGP76_13965 [Reichenbachiella sp. MSK19-1]SHJ66376.1 hypothetical protein SAMN04488028_101830 [Reichenbachiella agariperforans]
MQFAEIILNEVSDGLLLGGLVFFLLIGLILVAYYIDSLNLFYYRKVNFRYEDIEVTYWYKWKLLTSKGSPYFIWRKIRFENHSTKMITEHEIDPVSEEGHILYFYLDQNYQTHTGMLFDVLVVRDSDVSMGFDVYSLDYLDKAYVYERRVGETEYIGMVERGKFYESEGMFRNVQSKELNY